MARWTLVNVIIGCLSGGAVGVLASPNEEAAASHAKGRELLAVGDFEGASQAFVAAASAGRSDPRYRLDYTKLRKILQQRKSLARENDLERWLETARVLRDYYHEYRVYREALPIDREIHLRQADTASATLLAETQLALGMAADALETLRGLGDGEGNARTQVLLALALIRLDRNSEAKAAAAKVQVSDSDDWRALFDVARLHALLGAKGEACAMLVRSFEATPPSELLYSKAHAGECGDFKALADSTCYADALTTPSKVGEPKRKRRTPGK